MAYVFSSPPFGVSARRWWLGPTIVITVFLGITGVYGYRLILADVAYARLGVLGTNPWLQSIFLATAVWSVPIVLLLAFKTVLWLRYKPLVPLSFDSAPALTVVIPAYNEGAMVEKTIDSVASALYPAERLRIVVVDDGSRDDTWHYIDLASKRHRGRVCAVRFERNQGKRAALMEGFNQATGDVVVTIDSDSIIDSTTLLAMAAPFSDSKVAVVAGKVAVHNLEQGLIPRMLQFAYMLSFDFQRAAESQFHTVYCSPGALAAYRTSALREVQDRWLVQRFLGAPCTFGEDRALTNYLLAQGYDSVYQSNAVVRTLVPTTYAKLCKMFLRWNRSFCPRGAATSGHPLETSAQVPPDRAVG